MLKYRLLSAVIMLSLVGAAVFLPPVFKLIALLCICAVGMWEFYGILEKAGIGHYKFTGLACGCLLIAVTWFGLQFGSHEDAFALVLLMPALILAVVLIRQIFEKTDVKPLETIGSTLLGVFFVAFFLNFIGILLVGWGDSEGRFLLIYMVVVVKSTDIGAYFTGCAIGRHKLIPRISPAKTWEGCAGGLLTAVAASLIFLSLASWNIGGMPVRWTDGVVLAFLLAMAGIMGDLAESMVKRAGGIKDSGQWILGMGGLLDVIDSILFAAPILFVYVFFIL